MSSVGPRETWGEDFALGRNGAKFNSHSTKYDQIQDHVFIKINKCDLIQPKKFNQLQRKVKKAITINKKIDCFYQHPISWVKSADTQSVSQSVSPIGVTKT